MDFVEITSKSKSRGLWESALKQSTVTSIISLIIILLIQLVAVIVTGFSWHSLLQSTKTLYPTYLLITAAIFLIFLLAFRFKTKFITVMVIGVGTLFLFASIKQSAFYIYITPGIKNSIDTELFSLGLALITYAVAIETLPRNREPLLKEGEMLYLFNSSYDPLYQRNLLNTLFLPYGSTNEYRYTMSDTRTNVQPTILDLLSSLKGEDITISFIDRYGVSPNGNPSYKYYPIRRAKFIRGMKDNDRIYVLLQLLDYIFPSDVQATSDAIANLQGVAKLTNANPLEKNDGFYFLKADDIFGNLKFEQANSAWTKSVMAISTSRQFAGTQNTRYIFARAEFHEYENENKSINGKIGHNIRAYFPISKQKTHSFVISYDFPFFVQNQVIDTYLQTEASDNLYIFSNQKTELNSHSNRIELNFEPKSDCVDKNAYLKPTF